MRFTSLDNGYEPCAVYGLGGLGTELLEALKNVAAASTSSCWRPRIYTPRRLSLWARTIRVDDDPVIQIRPHIPRDSYFLPGRYHSGRFNTSGLIERFILQNWYRSSSLYIPDQEQKFNKYLNKHLPLSCRSIANQVSHSSWSHDFLQRYDPPLRSSYRLWCYSCCGFNYAPEQIDLSAFNGLSDLWTLGVQVNLASRSVIPADVPPSAHPKHTPFQTPKGGSAVANRKPTALPLRQ